jgi:hypothetical protein
MNYLKDKEKQIILKKALINENINKVKWNPVSWQIIMSYCSLADISNIFGTSKCFLIFKDMEANIFISGFRNSIKKPYYNNLTKLSPTFRNKVIKYAKPKYNSICEYSGYSNDFNGHYCHPEIDRNSICDAFIKCVKKNDIKQVKFILSIYGIYMSEVTAYKLELYTAEVSNIFIKLMEFYSVTHNSNAIMCNIKISYPFIIIPFILGNEKIARVVLEWIRNVNKLILQNKMPKNHCIFYSHMIDTHERVISIGDNRYGGIDTLICYYNDKNGWDLYDLHCEVRDASITIFNSKTREEQLLYSKKILKI